MDADASIRRPEDQADDERRREDPDQDDHPGRDFPRPCHPSHDLLRFLTAFREDIRGDETDHEHEPERDEDQIVQVSENRYEVRDEIDRGEGVADDKEGEELRVPGDAGVAAGQIEREGLPLQGLDAIFP